MSETPYPIAAARAWRTPCALHGYGGRPPCPACTLDAMLATDDEPPIDTAPARRGRMSANTREPERAGIYDAEPAEPSKWSAPREEAVEAAAKALHEADIRKMFSWEDVGENTRDLCRDMARAALSAARPPAPETCPDCNGTGGKYVDDHCLRCNGNGKLATPGDDATTKEGR